MILATHALVGAAIGKEVSDPWLVIALSLILHFTFDSFRHGEYFDSRTATIRDTWWKVALDLGTGASIILAFILLDHPDIYQSRNILLGTFTSMFPDFLTVLYWSFPAFPGLKEIKRFHSFSHRYSRFPKFGPERQWTLRNAANDIIISAIAIALLFL